MSHQKVVSAVGTAIATAGDEQIGSLFVAVGAQLDVLLPIASQAVPRCTSRARVPRDASESPRTRGTARRVGVERARSVCVAEARNVVRASRVLARLVSPFVGRVDDSGWDGMELIRNICDIYSNYDFTTQVLAASLRNSLHVIECGRAGADVGTMPFKVMDALFNHPLTDKGIEQFLKDHAKAFEPAGVR